MKIQETHLHHDQLKSQRGAAIVTSIFAMLLVTVIAFALIATGMVSLDISRNAREQTEAYYISESGLAHATNLILAAGPAEFNNILKAGDGTANTGDELSTRPQAQTPIPQVGLAMGNGTYVVRVNDDVEADNNLNVDTNGRLVITSIGNGQNGASVTTESIIGVTNMPALLVNGKLKINGNPSILGASGAVHANNTLDFDGNPCASQYFSSSANIEDPSKSQSGPTCKGAGINRAFQPIIPTPTYNIRNDFYNRADYILTSNGKVFQRNGNQLTPVTMKDKDWEINSDAKFSWDSGGRRWTHGGSKIPNGYTYYSEGNFELPSNFGSASFPAQVTFIAEGYISVNGNPYMRPKLDNFMLVAGTDLQISGNPNAGESNFQGISYAGHQIAFNGNPSINGLVIAANLADTNSPGCNCNFVPLKSGGFMEMSGNARITYNGGLMSSSPKLISWREVRN